MINRKGFTLIELLVVIAIIGLLSSIATISFNAARAKARDARKVSDAKQIANAIAMQAAQIDTSILQCGAGVDCVAGADFTTVTWPPDINGLNLLPGEYIISLVDGIMVSSVKIEFVFENGINDYGSGIYRMDHEGIVTGPH